MPEIIVRVFVVVFDFHDPHGQPCAEHGFGVFDNGLLPGIIHVSDDDYGVGDLLYEFDLLWCEGSAERGDRIVYADLVHADSVGIPLDEIHCADGRSLTCRLEVCEQMLTFFVDRRVTRVDVFRELFGVLLIHKTTGEADDVSCPVAYGEHQPPAESIVQGAVAFASADEVCVDQ